MKRQEILAFLRTAYSKAASNFDTEEERAFSIIEDFTDALGWQITRSNGGLFKKPSISIITDLGMRVITHENGKESVQSGRFDSFVEKAYSALFLKYNGVKKAHIRADFITKTQDEVYVKDMCNLLLAVGYNIKDISANKRRFKIYITDVALANGLGNEKLDTIFTGTDVCDWFCKYGGLVLGLALLGIMVLPRIFPSLS
jgi:hypothetical protein